MPYSQSSLVLYHCSFAQNGPLFHPMRGYDLETYLSLPYLYAVCVVDDSCQPVRMASGLMVKTEVEYGDPGFRACMEAAVRAVPQLDRQRLLREVSLLPAAVDCDTDGMITGRQALLVFQHLWSEHLTQQLMGRLMLAH